MTDIETLVRTELHRRYPIPPREADWADVLGRVTPVRRRRRPLVLAFATVALAAVAVSLAVVSPWNRGPGFMQQALAALGNGRYLHVVFQPTETAPVSVVDLASGREHPVTSREEWVFDTKTGAYEARAFLGSYVLEGPGRPDPAVSRFATGYRTALANGEARVVGRTTVGGVKATIIRFIDRSYRPFAFEDVAVSTATQRPLQVAYGELDAHGRPAVRYPALRVVSIDSSDLRRSLPKAAPSPAVIGFAVELRHVTVATAAAAFGRTPVWPGSTVAGATLRTLRLQRLTTSTALGGSTVSSLGLRLDYRGARGGLVVQEAPNPARSYGFWSAALGDAGPLPAAGRAVLACQSCRTGASRPLWEAQLRRAGLYVTIRSSSRALVVAAARALVPLP